MNCNQKQTNNNCCKPLTPFKWCIIENFPFIDTTFDALTNYQLLCKIIKYLNNVICHMNKTNIQVNELAKAFQELKDYVDNYFNSTDFQEMVNTKLDEMVEDGSLMNILSTYSYRVYNTTIDMLNDINLLLEGAKIQTLGYYDINDGGQSTFIISSIKNEYSFELSNGMFANIIINNIINFRQFGIIGDGETDVTKLVQKVFDYANTNNISNIHIPVGTYMIDCTTYRTTIDHQEIYSGIVLYPNINITMDNNAIMKVIPNSYSKHIMFDLRYCDNVSIIGGNIEGDRTEHQGSSGEWGYGIFTAYSSNILLKNINIYNMWGDGITLHFCSERILL